ncbi:MAG TPA: hypothetical protein DEF47_18405 [Herpetosiphon sp.]|uniref:Uncharacterized protein n=1 Tax=Herpetosiphon aurantiacus (strain ATCC 23779 / DSM 785 / 114-95) TaxID=316274 RepID=A9B558_HERA2|nr:hypothetical protein [Herpetosiphon sp.]ABX06195.1 hypothetical protein Haur_3559 [Herpetosiphon aurantiacus DSM 785]HBW51865.1 hypothetical protein [Herpetosiphon sp.]
MAWFRYWWLLLLLIGCIQTDQPLPTANQFAIYIFDQDAVPGLGSSAETAWPILQAVPLAQSAFTVTEDLLLSYHWQTQTITFTNPWGQTDRDAPGYMWNGGGSFVVIYNGQRLFGGKVVAAISPRRFDYPAMALSNDYILMENPELQGKLVYSFHPKSAVMYPPQSQFLAADPTITEAVKQHLREIGKLVE